jgi:stage II sporulation protein M
MLATYRRLIWRYHHYIWAATALFIVGILLGVLAMTYDPDTIQQIFQSVGEQLQQLGKDILGSPLGQGILILFWHNLRALLLVAALGLALGVYPAFSMLFNGLIIGLVGALSVQSSSLVTFLAGILPHGIFEIPALVLGAAIGLRLGIGPLVARRRSSFAMTTDTTWHGYGQELTDGGTLLTLAVMLLAIAASIEVGITPLVISWFQ